MWSDKKENRLSFLLKKLGGDRPGSDGAKETLLEQLEAEYCQHKEEKYIEAVSESRGAVFESQPYACRNPNCLAMVDVAHSYCTTCKDRKKSGVKLIHKKDPVYKIRQCAQCKKNWFTPTHGRQTKCEKCIIPKQENQPQKKEEVMQNQLNIGEKKRRLFTEEDMSNGRVVVLENPGRQMIWYKKEISRILNRNISWPSVYKFTDGIIIKNKSRRNNTSKKMDQRDLINLDFIKEANIDLLMKIQKIVDERRVELVDETTKKMKELESQLSEMKNFINRV